MNITEILREKIRRFFPWIAMMFAPAPYEEEEPQGEIEQNLANIWSKLLGIDRIRRNDNFFRLGGDSFDIGKMLEYLEHIGITTTVRDVFESPTLAVLATTVVRYNAVNIPPNWITEESTEITPDMLPLINLSQADIDTIVARIPGGIANIQDIYGLTPLQDAMLYHHMMAKEGDPYLMVGRLRFNNRKLLERYSHALQKVIRRHDVLRTAIFWDGLSEPAQVVMRQVSLIFTELTLDESDKPALDQLNEQFNSHRFRLDLSQAPLLRLLAAPESDGSWVALQLMHHSIIDNLTMLRIQAEICTIFNDKDDQPMISTPFRNFVAKSRLGSNTAEHTQFFTEMLGDISEPTLPFGLRNVSTNNDELNEAHLELSDYLYDELRAHARNLKVSLGGICHLAWAQVLAKASGRESVVFGTVLLGRFQGGEGCYNTMSPMINMLPLRLDINEESVKAAVHHSHSRLSALLAHEHAPLELPQRCSRVLPSLPLFSALLNYRHTENTKDIRTSLPGINLIDFEERTNYPLMLCVDDNGESLSLKAQIISPLSATRICAYMQQALQSLANALTYTPQQPVKTLKVIPPEERTMLLHSWNQTKFADSPVCCLHQLFEAQVENHGKSIAVEYEGMTLSYSELNAKANRLAHFLISKGVKSEDRIALCVERNVKLVIAILGILKSGGAYVPLDPAYPSQRLTNILIDVDPIILLTDATGCKALGDHLVPIVDLDKALSVETSIDNPDVAELKLTPTHLAYIIYTSGSTGIPKGVMAEHRNAVNCLRWINTEFKANEFMHTSFSTSVNFEMSLYEYFSALSRGKTIHVLPNVLSLSKSSNVSFLCTVPSAIKALLKTDSLPKSLKTIHLIGEPLEANLIKRIFSHTNRIKLCNLYGLTETSLFSTVYEYKRKDKIIETIGRPIGNTKIYLLDAQGEPVPIGATGEIYIGGAGVARGYFNRPELTAKIFLPDPFVNDPTARMCRTGDLARYSPDDGNVVLLGRADQQVKIRGFRIELGEIETRLIEHPQVNDAVVKPNGSGSNVHLVAYVVANGESFQAQSLRTYLSDLLPDYMIPAAFMRLPSLPLTPNGKIDRQALPDPDNEAFVRQQYEAPHGEIEEKLANIWCELLKVDRVSRHDNFFESGGHSLLVMHLVNKAKFLNIHITARGVFFFPILKKLAEQITNRSERFYCSDAAIPVRRYGKEPPLFLLPDVLGIISHAFELAQDIDENIPVYVLPWSSPESEQPSSMEQLASTMINHIKKIQPNGPCSIAGYSAGGVLALEIARQLTRNDYPVSFLGLIDTYSPTAPITISQSEWFLLFLYQKFPNSRLFNNLKWWKRVSKLSLNEAIDEIRMTDFNSNNTDIEWEALLSQQSFNYMHLCAAYKIDSPPTKIHFFKGADESSYDVHKKYCEKIIWRNLDYLTNLNVLNVGGNHWTMLSDPKNRSVLGKKLTESLLSKNNT